MACGGLVVLAAALLFLVGWGDVSSALALHGPAMLLAEGLLLSAGAYGVLHGMAILHALDSLPFVPGMYLFPACVVDACQPLLRVWAIADAETIERAPPPEHALVLSMRDGSRTAIPAADATDLDRAEAALGSVRVELARAAADDDASVLAELDPLHDRALSNPLGPTTAMRRARPLWIRLDWGLAAALGMTLGLVLGTVRNTTSDERIMRGVLSIGTVGAFEQYVARGGRHSAEVRDVLLPRAQLREVESHGNVGALLAFARDHASANIAPEIDAAVRRAMLLELDKAKRTGTVAALNEFARAYPDANVGPELKAARHALYVQALAAWKGQAQPDADATSFMEGLLTATERNGPVCEVRFRMRPTRSVDEADRKIAKNDRYPGPDALPSHYLTAEAMRPRERRTVETIAEAFKVFFPPDMLLLRPGEPLPPDAPLAASTPTLFVEYAPEWARTVTVSVKPSTAFAPINFAFDAAFVLPEGPTRKVSTRWTRGVELWKLRSTGLSREDFEQKVYGATIDPAFDQLAKKMRDAFL
ncbi:MAG: hypothetical protein M3O50_09605 [Myxococcota bacterium]|nr:hypothetical protein [Myxococcota bacterium]